MRKVKELMLEEVVEITNPTGLHARPAAMFVQTAAKFSSHIWVIKNEKRVNAKSIMGLMSLAVSRGTKIVVGAEGDDEEVAVKELITLISENFYEDI
jgi:phosphocarrier protein